MKQPITRKIKTQLFRIILYINKKQKRHIIYTHITFPHTYKKTNNFSLKVHNT